MLHMLLTPVLLATHLTALQPQQNPAPVIAWIAFQNRHNRVASVSPSYVSREESIWSLKDSCTVQLESKTDYGTLSSKTRYQVALGRLDPNGEITTASDEGLPTTLAFQVPDGSKDVHIQTDRNKFDLPIWVISLSSDVRADSAKTLAAAAIRACGGRESTTQEKDAQAARIRTARSGADSILGRIVAPEFRGLLVDRCQSEIKRTLKSPSTAIFDTTVSVLRDKANDTFIVLGSLEAENALGGRLAMQYTCHMEKYGEQWMANRPLLL
jgi:hypothetical protein